MLQEQQQQQQQPLGADGKGGTMTKPKLSRAKTKLRVTGFAALGVVSKVHSRLNAEFIKKGARTLFFSKVLRNQSPRNLRAISCMISPFLSPIL